MNIFLKAILLFAALYCGSSSVWAEPTQKMSNEKNYFQFVIPKYLTKRQGGQTVSIYARYAYNKDLPTSKYVDYRILREDLLSYMEPSAEFPAQVYWEILATEMGRKLMKDYPFAGVSIQLEVLDNPDPNVYEPGDHGPVFTTGTIAPLDVHH